MHGVTKLSVMEDISLITFHKTPTDLLFMTEVFELFAARGINVDMISQTAAQGFFCSLSFTVPGHLVISTLEAVGKCAHAHPDIKPLVSSGNSKISLFGEEMRDLPGVAAKALRVLLQAGIDIRMITTSEVDISVLVSDVDLPAAVDALEMAFELKK